MPALRRGWSGRSAAPAAWPASVLFWGAGPFNSALRDPCQESPTAVRSTDAATANCLTIRRLRAATMKPAV
eukprot:6347634-Pyramimonas_sp.AAC.1